MIRCVGAVIHNSSGRLLLVRRARQPGRGLWSLPGGRVEPGETDTQAVTRELGEETGLLVRPERLVGQVYRPAPNGTFVIFDYACTVVGGRLRAGDDALDVSWIDSARFYTLDRSGQLVDGLAATLRDWRMLPRG